MRVDLRSELGAPPGPAPSAAPDPATSTASPAVVADAPAGALADAPTGVVADAPTRVVADAPTGVVADTAAGARDEVSHSGSRGVSGHGSGGAPPGVPDALGRTAYRIVQEALTNARKHASGAAVRVRLAGAPGPGLTVEVHNDAINATDAADVIDPASGSASSMTARPPPPPGQGLIGLAERVALADGRLDYGPTSDGGWRLSAWLPWPP
jgi:hypothetical protein